MKEVRAFWGRRDSRAPARSWEGDSMSSKLMMALCATAAIVGLTGARGAVAQQADQQAAANAGGGMEEIVVTARRKEERLQSVPLAITAFSQADLDKQHIQEVRDLGRTVPSLAV